MWIGHRKEIWKLTFRALALRRFICRIEYPEFQTGIFGRMESAPNQITVRNNCFSVPIRIVQVPKYFCEESSRSRLLSIMPNWLVRDHWDYPRKMNNIFQLKRANQYEWLLPFFTPFPNSVIRTKNKFVKNGMAKFGQNIPTEISGTPI